MQVNVIWSMASHIPADLSTPIYSQVLELKSFSFAICLPEYSRLQVS